MEPLSLPKYLFWSWVGLPAHCSSVLSLICSLNCLFSTDCDHHWYLLWSGHCLVVTDPTLCKYYSESFRHLLWRWSARKANCIVCYLSKLNYIARGKKHTQITQRCSSRLANAHCAEFSFWKAGIYSHIIMLWNKKESGIYKLIDWK